MVFSTSDSMLPDLSAAIKAAKLDARVLIGSDDGQMAVAKLMIDDPAGPVQADVSNLPFEQGRIAVQTAIAAARGDRSGCPSGRRLVDATLITPKTATAFYNPDRPY
jgi:ribose transport system substrate-binding protein